MECTSLLEAFRTEGGETIFSDFGRRDVVCTIWLRCGQCMGCRLTAAAKWSVRCVHEAKLYGVRNSFVTLTVDDAHLQEIFPRASLTYEPYQLFMKRLRYKQADRVRFRMSAEYGEQDGQRPHYHALLFNLWPEDAKPWRKSGDGQLYRSAALEELWPFGQVEFGRVVPQTAAYVNGYVTKKLSGEAARRQYARIDARTGEVYELRAPFSRSSTVPAIGIEWFTRHLADFVNADGVVLAGGTKVGMPKAYDNWLDKHMPEQLEELKFSRELAGRERFLKDPNEQSDERLAVKDECYRARVASKQRGAL